MTTTTSAIPSSAAAAATSRASSGSTAATTAKEANDRFLKLLVTQLQNQDPMNPMDNAQMTTQMAQISTVSGIEKLNTTVAGLTGQFMQMQALQGASLIGKEVIVKGDKLTTAEGVTQGLYQLDTAADRVKIEVLSPAGTVVDTLGDGAQTIGRHEFTWPGAAALADPTGYRFRVTASSGSTTLSTTALTRDRVDAVNTTGSTLTLELVKAGSVPYSSIHALE
jgi:flagellar basal-body rod modification protein FlgD